MTGWRRQAAGPVSRVLSSGLRGRLRRFPVVGLGAAGSGPDWRSIQDVLSVARFASALVPKHQSPQSTLASDQPFSKPRPSGLGSLTGFREHVWGSWQPEAPADPEFV